MKKKVVTRKKSKEMCSGFIQMTNTETGKVTKFDQRIVLSGDEKTLTLTLVGKTKGVFNNQILTARTLDSIAQNLMQDWFDRHPDQLQSELDRMLKKISTHAAALKRRMDNPEAVTKAVQ